jgi:hypothetical protein
MKIPFRLLIMPVLLVSGIFQLSAQDHYSGFREMLQKMNALSSEYPSLCTIKSLVRTTGGKDILVLTIGTGDKDSKPGIAVLGGIEGSHILGKELASGFAASLLKDSATPEIKELLGKVTFYIFPDVSPDATEQYFSELKYERTVNNRSTDDDRDFKYDEDPFDDLNKDGYITLIRVADPSGKFIESKEDSRLMVPADLALGQTGSYIVLTEGIDNDKDGEFNEDGEGGVCFNRNFTYNYEEYGLNAGLHAVSEPETKAVADFLFDRFNIYAVFSFGPQDNLGQPMKSAEKPAAAGSVQNDRANGQRQGMPRGDRKITSILRSDETINKLVSDKYHEITGVKGAPATKTIPGNFMEWAYFHYGRYSFGTPAWWLTAEKGKSAEAVFLKYAEKKNMNDVFVPWTEVSDPDFPGKKTEVGGIKPFVLNNPPADTLGELVSKNYKFITAIAAMHPELEFLDITTENAGDNVFRITLKLHNKGVFATCTEAGDANMWTRIMRLSLETEKSQGIVSGQKVQRVKRLEGDESQEFSWLIMGKGSVKVTAGAINTGTVSANIVLR